MEKQHKIGLGAFALIMGVAFVAMRPEPTTQAEIDSPRQARLQLASVTPSARRDIDYAALDARLQRLAEKRAVVGLAVGIVENGRITFLSGYGEA